MSTLTIQLSDEEQTQWEKKAAEHGFSSAGEYVLHLARESRPAEQVSPELQALLEEGADSEPIVADDQFWAELHQEVVVAR